MFYTLKGFKLPEPAEAFDVEHANYNAELTDELITEVELKVNAVSNYQKATGTATSIVVQLPELSDGLSTTFIASANNGGSATLINGKSVYKPNTAIAPNIKAGKAITVWYDLTGDCFFLKASAEGNAVAANVLAGTTFSNDDDAGILGTMVSNGPVTEEIITLSTEGQEYGIAAGNHSGLRKIKAAITNLAAGVIKAGTTVGGILGTFTSDATAVAGNILAGMTAYVNGNKITGTMPNNGALNSALAVNGTYNIPAGYTSGGAVTQALATKAAATITPGTANQAIAAGQYLSGVQTILGDADLISANIKAGKNIFGVAGNANVVDTSAGTATASQILSGKIAYVDGNKITGSMPSKGAQTYTPSTSNQTVAAGQYLSGAQTIAGSANLVPENIKDGVNIFGKIGTYKTEYQRIESIVSSDMIPIEDADIIIANDGTSTKGFFVYWLKGIGGKSLINNTFSQDFTGHEVGMLSTGSGRNYNVNRYYIQ